MFASLDRRLERLLAAGGAAVPIGGLVGIEKEALRAGANGRIAQTAHPEELGAALTHPHITTDYSEALLELITPPSNDPADTLRFLDELHRFVHRHLEGETLWPASMPCICDDPSHIPVAQYGSSNAGRMKTLYRVGLGHRYGRMMQIIAGVHFNYSVPESFWPIYQQLEGDGGDLRQFRDRCYFAMLRNLQRLGWIIPYLFGASPAVCKTFLAHDQTHLRNLTDGTRFEPCGTSLRMGDIGYTNHQEEGVGIKACYDNLACYLDSLEHAISTPSDQWEAIGLRNARGELHQLNTNILQIENEYYSTVRPKQVQQHLEKPVHALREKGVLYVELRSLDIDPFDPLGISETRMRFLEVFMLLALLADSPPIDERERRQIDRNLVETAHLGRADDFQLARHDGPVERRIWLEEIFDAMSGICEMLNRSGSRFDYVRMLADLVQNGCDPEHTPSARILRILREEKIEFFDFTDALARQYRADFLQKPLAASRLAELEAEARDSIQRQRLLEETDTQPFESFLANYWAS